MMQNVSGDEVLLEYFDDLLQAPVSPAAKQPSDYFVFFWGRLKLAFDKTKLQGVSDFPDSYAANSGKRLLGITQYQGSTVPVIDLAEFLLTPGTRARDSGFNDNYGFLIILSGGVAALPCHRVVGVQNIAGSDIRLRSDRTTRTWLLGTSLGQQCAILDIPGLLAGIDKM